MGRFDASLLCVVDGDLSRLLGTLADTLAGILRGALGKVEGIYTAIGCLDGYGFCSLVHMLNRAVGCL
jgi:hypothetical protein